MDLHQHVTACKWPEVPHLKSLPMQAERPPAGSATASVGPGQGPVPVLSAAATYMDAPPQGEPGAGPSPLCCITLASDCRQLATGGNDNQVGCASCEGASCCACAAYTTEPARPAPLC